MINKIIWKVLFIVGGIVGSIFSITKLLEGFENLDMMNHSLERVISYGIYSSVSDIKAEINEIKIYLFAWSAILVVSAVIFIVGCMIKTDSHNSK